MQQTTTWLYTHHTGPTQEVWTHHAHDIASLLAAAHRDALALRCGRDLVGLIAVEPGPTEPIAVPSDPAGTQRRLLAELGLRGLPVPAAEPRAHRVDWHTDPLDVPWWSVTSPFGSGSLAGLAAIDCTRRGTAGTDATTWLGECIAHQSSLYAVTPLALPFVVDLLAARVPGHEVLAGWLLVIAESAVEVGPESPEAVWRAMRDTLPAILRDSMEARTKEHVASGHRIQALWPGIAAGLRSRVNPDLVDVTLETLEAFG
ncbi:MAG: hypothetical protein R3F61_29605 [Myxococcota bacterium]